jgi:hypothetical protein
LNLVGGCQSLEPGLRILDGVNVIPQNDPLRRMGEAHRCQPAAIGQCPGTNPSVDLAVAQQKTLQMLARLG